jgi:hypothetical protein
MPGKSNHRTKSYKRKCQETDLAVGSVPTLFCLGIQPNRLNVHARSAVSVLMRTIKTYSKRGALL